METNKKCAVLVVSFGTTHLDTMEHCILSTEEQISRTFAEYPVYRAFLSPTIIRRLKENHGVQIDNLKEALARIEEDGYEQAVIQPTLLLRGIEYDLLKKECEKTKLKTVIGQPLLETEQDCEILAELLIEENPLKEGEALVLMGHGTEHEANQIYHTMQRIFDEKEYPCFLGTVEGTPTFENAVKRLKAWGAAHAKLMPLMFVAGDHAKNDMAGEEGSLLSMVCEAGIPAEPVFRGLGESRNVQKLYTERVKHALEEMKTCS